MSLTTEEAFRQDILANPGDDTPRLIYADWLDEQGATPSPRAALIRVQCEMGRVEEHSPRWRKLAQEEKALLKKHKKEWTAPFRGLTVFERLFRGFVEEVTLYAKKFCQRGSRLFEIAPLRRVKVSAVHHAYDMGHAPLSEVLAVPWMTKVRELDLDHGMIGDEGARQLALCPSLTQLRWLDMSFNQISEVGMRALLGSPSLAGVHTLLVGDTSLITLGREGRGGDALAEAVALESRPGQLTTLSLAGQPITDRGLRALALSGSLSGLKTLTLSRCSGIGSAGLKALGESAALGGLEVLSLNSCGIAGPEGVESLAASPHLTRLRHLDLGLDSYPYGVPRDARRGIGDAGVTALARSPAMATLRYLDLCVNQVTDAGARAILESGHLQGLYHLNLKGNQISKELQKALRARYGVGVCSFSIN